MPGKEIRGITATTVYKWIWEGSDLATAATKIRTFLAALWLGLYTPKAGGPGLVSSQGTRSCMPQLWPGAAKLKKKKKEKKEIYDIMTLIGIISLYPFVKMYQMVQLKLVNFFVNKLYVKNITSNIGNFLKKIPVWNERKSSGTKLKLGNQCKLC